MASVPELVATLRAAYPNAKVGTDTVRVYVRALADIPAEELEPVVVATVASSPYFPTVADLRTAVVERRLALPSREDAWARACASRDDVPLSTLSAPERAALDHVGGRYGIKSSEEPSIVRAQFLKAYDAERRRAVESANVDAIAPGARAIGAGSTT